MSKSGIPELAITLVAVAAAGFYFYLPPHVTPAPVEHFRAPSDPVKDAEDIRANLATSTNHRERLRMLGLLKDLDPSDSTIDAQMHKESSALDAEDLAFSARRAKVVGLSDGKLCAQLRRNPSDQALIVEYDQRAGGDGHLTSVLARSVVMGMNEFEIKCAWGEPDRVHLTVISTALQEKTLVFHDSDYVYLRNGVMTALQR